jgi:hypothetical protein
MESELITKQHLLKCRDQIIWSQSWQAVTLLICLYLAVVALHQTVTQYCLPDSHTISSATEPATDQEHILHIRAQRKAT